MSKADARDWHEQQRREKELVEDLEEHTNRLFYAGCKRHQMPDPDVFHSAGKPEVANKISQALSLLDDAYYEALK